MKNEGEKMKKKYIIILIVLGLVGIIAYLGSEWCMRNSYIIVKDDIYNRGNGRTEVYERKYTREKMSSQVYYDEVPSYNLEKEIIHEREGEMDQAEYEKLMNYFIYKKQFFIRIKEGRPIGGGELEIKYGLMKKHVYTPTSDEELNKAINKFHEDNKNNDFKI